jgi:hypothetical protein
MLGVTLFGIFLTPIFLDVIQRLVDARQRRRTAPNAAASWPPS